MIDRAGRDQFAIRHGDETEIGWNDPQRNTTKEVSMPDAAGACMLQVLSSHGYCHCHDRLLEIIGQMLVHMLLNLSRPCML